MAYTAARLVRRMTDANARTSASKLTLPMLKARDSAGLAQEGLPRLLRRFRCGVRALWLGRDCSGREQPGQHEERQDGESGLQAGDPDGGGVDLEGGIALDRRRPHLIEHGPQCGDDADVASPPGGDPVPDLPGAGVGGYALRRRGRLRARKRWSTSGCVSTWATCGCGCGAARGAR